MKTITIIYKNSTGVTRMKIFKENPNWVQQCYELDTKYSNWKIV